jgi:hypothetical protein
MGERRMMSFEDSGVLKTIYNGKTKEEERIDNSRLVLSCETHFLRTNVEENLLSIEKLATEKKFLLLF